MKTWSHNHIIFEKASISSFDGAIRAYFRTVLVSNAVPLNFIKNSSVFMKIPNFDCSCKLLLKRVLSLFHQCCPEFPEYYISSYCYWHSRFAVKKWIYRRNLRIHLYMLTYYISLTHLSPVMHFIYKPVMWILLQIKWLVSIWNATLGWNE